MSCSDLGANFYAKPDLLLVFFLALQRSMFTKLLEKGREKLNAGTLSSSLFKTRAMRNKTEYIPVRKHGSECQLQ